MSEPLFSRGELIAVIDDGKRDRPLYASRIDALNKAGVLPVVSRTRGGQARFGNDARVIAVVANLLLDWGLQHPQRLPESERATHSRSVFWAVAAAFDPLTIDFVMTATREGRDWLLRIDRITGHGGQPTFLARVYPATDDRNHGETPEGCTSTLGVGLLPILSHLVGEG